MPMRIATIRALLLEEYWNAMRVITVQNCMASALYKLSCHPLPAGSRTVRVLQGMLAINNEVH